MSKNVSSSYHCNSTPTGFQFQVNETPAQYIIFELFPLIKRKSSNSLLCLRQPQTNPE
jgi:hypothetical protein